jgi:hypothetical protein
LLKTLPKVGNRQSAGKKTKYDDYEVMQLPPMPNASPCVPLIAFVI